jgi:hypothetical protein
MTLILNAIALPQSIELRHPDGRLEMSKNVRSIHPIVIEALDGFSDNKFECIKAKRLVNSIMNKFEVEKITITEKEN